MQGYLAQYDPGSVSYSQASPIDGASVVNSSGMETALGLDLHPVSVSAGGYGIGSQSTSLSIDCSAGSDGKLGVPDSCFANVGGNTTSAHVVDCKDSPQIP